MKKIPSLSKFCADYKKKNPLNPIYVKKIGVSKANHILRVAAQREYVSLYGDPREKSKVKKVTYSERVGTNFCKAANKFLGTSFNE